MKKYKNSDIIIEWQPERCQHSGIYIRILPEVYNLKKPWINMDQASTTDLNLKFRNVRLGH
ncbi:MAG: (4Fe-4S)-binding protein [Flavobacteriaceae bacterium]